MRSFLIKSITASLLLTSAASLPSLPVHESHAATQVDAMKSESAAARYSKATANISPTPLNASTVNAFNSGKIINTKTLNKEILKLINKERKANGVNLLSYNTNTAIIKGTDTRAKEVTNFFSHTRPNGAHLKTAFPKSLQSSVKGENVMRRSYSPNLYAVTSEKYLAEMMFNQWKLSKDHRANLLRPAFKMTSIQAKIAYTANAPKPGYYYYAVQIFTTK